MSFFQKIGLFFQSFFNAAARAYKRLTPEQKAALLVASGITDIINKKLDETPAAIRQAIQEKYPELDVAKLEAALFELAKSMNLTTADNMDAVIVQIQAKLKEAEGRHWANISNTIAKTLAVFLAPAETKVAVIISLIEFVYQKFIKKSI